jgi:hypothetical protein
MFTVVTSYYWNIKWFYLRNLSVCLHFISTPVKHPDDNRKSNRNKRLIIYVKVCFTGVHLLVHCVRVNIGLTSMYELKI